MSIKEGKSDKKECKKRNKMRFIKRSTRVSAWKFSFDKENVTRNAF